MSAVIEKNGNDEKKSGSPESQIALFTKRIAHLSQHLSTNKWDNVTKLTLTKLVSKRKTLLGYLSKNDVVRYRKIVKELDMRK